MSAYDLAKAAGLSHTAIYAWVRAEGKRPPLRENVERVAAALGTTYDELWGSELSSSERTRLARLELFAQRVAELVHELEKGPRITEQQPERVLPAPGRTHRRTGGSSH